MTLRNAARAAMLALLLCWSALAAAQLPVPALTARVIDQTATLTVEQKAALERTLESFETKKGSQIAVLIVPTTAPETIEQFAIRVAEQWKLGRKKVDDGALLLVAKNDRALRIEVGYGLEGALNDATSKRIISEIIVPHFQQGDFYGGIQAGVDRIMRVIDGEPLPPPQPRRTAVSAGDGGLESYLPIVFLLALVVGGLLRAMLGRFTGALATGGALGMIAWWFAGTVFIALVAGVIAFVITLLGSGRGGFIPGGFGGGSGGFGSGGGGFGGGGGTFGGGGASGRW